MKATIFVNTHPVNWGKTKITYEEIVQYLYGKRKDVQPSMTFHIGAYSGILLPGQSVTVVDQMKINAFNTSNA